MSSKFISRREAIRHGSAGVAALCMVSPSARGEEPAKPGADQRDASTLGFSTYGMKRLKTEYAIREVAECGYDAIEIAVRPDWDSAPGRMSPERRTEARKILGDTGLRLSALMEHMFPSDNDKEHAAQLERLAGVFELAHDLSPDNSPLVQTVLGSGQWQQRRDLLRDRLIDWVKVAEKQQIVLAVKPHRGGCMSRPSEAVWMIEQLGKPRWLRMVYDYSHYAFREMPLDATIATALPYTAHVAVKDAVQEGGRVAFKLPGESGAIDFARLIRKFHDGGYRGDFNCEVSGMVWGKPGYDPLIAAKKCYGAMAQAFQDAGVSRPTA